MSSADRPIKDYGLIGNCETAALVNKHGGIDWLCLPAFDAPSFFGALLDREKGGEFSIRPAGEFRIEQSRARLARDDTSVLERVEPFQLLPRRAREGRSP
ncbi:MAG: trehalase-like domain-containing protein [Chthoniobacterales bacterium]